MFKKLAFLLSLLFQFMHSSHAQTDFESYPFYGGTDLGLTYTTASSRFRIWSPPAEKAELLLYKTGESEYPYRIVPLTKDSNGTWFTEINENLKGIFYTFKVYINHQWSHEVTDPYAKICGINGKKALIDDIRNTDPLEWDNDKSPAFSEKNLPTDAIIYELHVRDASIHSSSGIKNKGKFLGLAEPGTKTAAGHSTGLSHLKEMGVTHIHLLPFFDFYSLDEKDQSKLHYNWGYDPLHYNIPEGTYSTNAYDGITRIRELKEMILAMHRVGLRVVMDVVYNHTGLTEKSNFNQLVPGYYYRHKKNGGFSDATACGNETASEMPMMRKFIIESLKYWVKEYHVDGFRFDLMGVHDIETMNKASEELRKIKPDILLYGEGWTAGDSPLPDSMRALKRNVSMLKNIAVFSDDARNAIKGSVFEHTDKGFASGKTGIEDKVKFAIVASCKHPQLNNDEAYALSPADIITYCECHDNHSLWDKLSLSNPDATEAERRKMHQLAITMLLSSQGIAFLHAGTEFYRSKQGVENSYKSPDSINAINWNEKDLHINFTQYVQSLIKMRKEHPAFRLQTAEEIASLIHFTEKTAANIVAYTIDGAKAGDEWKKIFVAFNGSSDIKEIGLPTGVWKKGISNFETSDAIQDKLVLPQWSAIILYQR